jgi:hypothetical protein
VILDSMTAPQINILKSSSFLVRFFIHVSLQIFIINWTVAQMMYV